MRDDRITTQMLDAERLVALSSGIVPPPAVGLDQSLSISADERLVWERQLNRYLNSCGCAEGAVGLFVGVAVVLVAYCAQTKPWSAWDIAAAVALPLVLLVGGKTVGRRLDRLRFRKVCKRLLSRLTADNIRGGHHG